MAYDYVVVGAGLFGSSFARAVTDLGKKVLVLDKRQHIGGMCFTERVDGVLVHAYGPHIFHTDSDKIWKWITRFAEFYSFMVRTKAIHQGKIYTLPFNLMTFHQLWGVTTPEEARKKLDSVRIPIQNPGSIEEWALSQFGPEIYEKFILDYTRKQWGRDPKNLPLSTLKRLPVRLTFDDNYFNDKYQGLPVGGYTEMFGRMLDGIEVRLGVDFFEDQPMFERLGQVIYSGRVDQFFNYVFGDLDFRSCKFDTKSMDGDYQGNPIIHYSEAAYPWTRVTEHKHLENPSLPRTLVTWEYPFECDRLSTPFYPVNDAKNMTLYDRYRQLPTKVIFGGRLGSYRYRDMHHVIGEALALADRLLGASA